MISMKNQPLVSVIIPTYNSASTLEACLRSINAETCKNVVIEIGAEGIVSAGRESQHKRKEMSGTSLLS